MGNPKDNGTNFHELILLWAKEFDIFSGDNKVQATDAYDFFSKWYYQTTKNNLTSAKFGREFSKVFARGRRADGCRYFLSYNFYSVYKSFLGTKNG
jgi:hypothetical protein